MDKEEWENSNLTFKQRNVFMLYSRTEKCNNTPHHAIKILLFLICFENHFKQLTYASRRVKSIFTKIQHKHTYDKADWLRQSEDSYSVSGYTKISMFEFEKKYYPDGPKCRHSQ